MSEEFATESWDLTLDTLYMEISFTTFHFKGTVSVISSDDI